MSGLIDKVFSEYLAKLEFGEDIDIQQLKQMVLAEIRKQIEALGTVYSGEVAPHELFTEFVNKAVVLERFC